MQGLGSNYGFNVSVKTRFGFVRRNTGVQATFPGIFRTPTRPLRLGSVRIQDTGLLNLER
jgi:hypothetical protein